MTTIQINPDGTIEKVKKSDIVKDIKNSKYYALTPEQRAFLLRDIKTSTSLVFNQKHLVTAYLTMYGGLRRGEVTQARKEWLAKVRIQIEGVEREFLAIHIPYRANDIRKGKGKYIWKAKTRNSERMALILDEKVSTEIEAFFLNNPKGVQCSTDYIYKFVASDKRYSFKSRLINCEETYPDGSPIIDDHEKERLKNITPHALRATYAYLCKELDLNDEIIAALMGHDDIKTLKKSYFKNTNQGLLMSIKRSMNRSV